MPCGQVAERIMLRTPCCSCMILTAIVSTTHAHVCSPRQDPGMASVWEIDVLYHFYYDQVILRAPAKGAFALSSFKWTDSKF